MGGRIGVIGWGAGVGGTDDGYWWGAPRDRGNSDGWGANDRGRTWEEFFFIEFGPSIIKMVEMKFRVGNYKDG